MSQLLRMIIAVLAAGTMVALPTQVATAGPIDLPPDGEAQLTISLVGDEDLVDRIELFLTAAGMDMFDSACAPTDTARGAVVSYECNGLMQRAHFLEVDGALDGESVYVQCAIPGTFDDNRSGLVDLVSYPNVLDCTVTVTVPGIRVYVVDAAGDIVDPPATVDVFNFFEDSISTLDCVPSDVAGSPALFCDTPPFGEYEIVAPGGVESETRCTQRLLGPTELGFAQDPFFFVDDFGPEFDSSSIVTTCVIREFGDSSPGETNEFFVDIQSSDPGPDLVPQLISDGTDRLSDCVRVFDQSWRCSDLPPGTYTVSATGLLPGQFAAVTCFGPSDGVGDTFDLAVAPFGVNCSIRVDTPQIVFPDFGQGESNYVVLDSDGNDVGDVCGPSVVDGTLVIACPLPLGDYTVPEQDVEPFGLSEFTCSQNRAWFFENTITLSDESGFEESIVVRCDLGAADRRTSLYIQVVNPIAGMQLLLDGVPFEQFEGPGECFDTGGGEPDVVVVVEYFCDIQGARTIVPTIGDVGPERAPTIECRTLDEGDTAPSLQADLSEAQPDWECTISFRVRLPDTGPSGETSVIAFLGAALLAAGVALTTLGTRRRLH